MVNYGIGSTPHNIAEINRRNRCESVQSQIDVKIWNIARRHIDNHVLIRRSCRPISGPVWVKNYSISFSSMPPTIAPLEEWIRSSVGMQESDQMRRNSSFKKREKRKLTAQSWSHQGVLYYVRFTSLNWQTEYGDRARRTWWRLLIPASRHIFFSANCS